MDFPEPLFESTHLTKPKVCLVCGKKQAKTVLRNTERDVCPLCVDCSANWNFHGYDILKRVKPLYLLWNIYKFKVMHPFQVSPLTIWADVKSLQQWGKHMKQFRIRNGDW